MFTTATLVLAVPKSILQMGQFSARQTSTDVTLLSSTGEEDAEEKEENDLLHSGIERSSESGCTTKYSIDDIANRG